jgi:very-short-patch-repair endonuclease
MMRSIRRRRSSGGVVNPWVGRALGWAAPRPTNLERMMARALTEANVRFTQFVPIGPYEVDFYLPGFAVIEVDGAYWHDNPKRKDKDIRKDRYLRACGYKVFRFREDLVKSDAAACVRAVLNGR